MLTTYPLLSFDEEQHVYQYNGHVVPSVTTVIRSHITAWQADEWYLKRGRAVHAAVSLHLQGKLDVDSTGWREWEQSMLAVLDADKVTAILGRTRAVVKFIADTGFQVTATEVPMYSKRYGFAGTIDGDLLDKRAAVVLGDWKGSLEPAACDAQLGGYSVMHGEHTGLLVPRVVAVETHDDGTYKLRWGVRHRNSNVGQFDLGQAESAFLNMLSVYNWRLKHNV